MKRGIKFKPPKLPHSRYRFEILKKPETVIKILLLAYCFTCCRTTSMNEEVSEDSVHQVSSSEAPNTPLVGLKCQEQHQLDRQDLERAESLTEKNDELLRRRHLLDKLLSRPKHILSLFMPQILSKQLVLKKPNNIGTIVIPSKMPHPVDHTQARPSSARVSSNTKLILMATSSPSRDEFIDNFYAETTSKSKLPNIMMTHNASSPNPFDIRGDPLKISQQPHKNILLFKELQALLPATKHQASIGVPVIESHNLGIDENEQAKFDLGQTQRESSSSFDPRLVNSSQLYLHKQANLLPDPVWLQIVKQNDEKPEQNNHFSASLIPSEITSGWQPATHLILPPSRKFYPLSQPQHPLKHDSFSNPRMIDNRDKHNFQMNNHWTSEIRAPGGYQGLRSNYDSDESSKNSRRLEVAENIMQRQKQQHRQQQQLQNDNTFEGSGHDQRMFMPSGFQTIVQLRSNNNTGQLVADQQTRKMSAASNKMMTVASSNDRSPSSQMDLRSSSKDSRSVLPIEIQSSSNRHPAISNTVGIRPLEPHQHSHEEQHRFSDNPNSAKEPQRARSTSQDALSKSFKQVSVLTLEKDSKRQGNEDRLAEHNQPIGGERDGIILSETLRKLRETRARIQHLQAELNATNPGLLERLINREVNETKLAIPSGTKFDRLPDDTTGSDSEFGEYVDSDLETDPNQGPDDSDKSHEFDEKVPFQALSDNSSNLIEEVRDQKTWSPKLESLQRVQPNMEGVTTLGPPMKHSLLNGPFGIRSRGSLTGPARILGSAIGQAAQTVAAHLPSSGVRVQTPISVNLSKVRGTPVTILPNQHNSQPVLVGTSMTVAESGDQTKNEKESDKSQTSDNVDGIELNKPSTVSKDTQISVNNVKTNPRNIRQQVKMDQFSVDDATNWPGHLHNQHRGASLSTTPPTSILPIPIGKTITTSVSDSESRNEDTQQRKQLTSGFSNIQLDLLAGQRATKFISRGLSNSSLDANSNITTTKVLVNNSYTNSSIETNGHSADGNTTLLGRMIGKLMTTLGLSSSQHNISSPMRPQGVDAPLLDNFRITTRQNNNSIPISAGNDISTYIGRPNEPKLTTEKVLMKLVTFACLIVLLSLMLILVVVWCQTKFKSARSDDCSLSRQQSSTSSDEVVSSNASNDRSCKTNQSTQYKQKSIDWRRLIMLASELGSNRRGYGKCNRRDGGKKGGDSKRRGASKVQLDGAMRNVSLLAKKRFRDNDCCICNCKYCLNQTSDDLSSSSAEMSSKLINGNIYRSRKLPFGAASSVNCLLADRQPKKKKQQHNRLQQSNHIDGRTQSSGLIRSTQMRQPICGTRLKLMSAIEESDSFSLRHHCEDHSMSLSSEVAGCTCGLKAGNPQRLLRTDIAPEYSCFKGCAYNQAGHPKSQLQACYDSLGDVICKFSRGNSDSVTKETIRANNELQQRERELCDCDRKVVKSIDISQEHTKRGCSEAGPGKNQTPCRPDDTSADGCSRIRAIEQQSLNANGRVTPQLDLKTRCFTVNCHNNDEAKYSNNNNDNREYKQNPVNGLRTQPKGLVEVACIGDVKQIVGRMNQQR